MGDLGSCKVALGLRLRMVTLPMWKRLQKGGDVGDRQAGAYRRGKMGEPQMGRQHPHDVTGLYVI